jgi:hypothetical protein
MIAIAVLLVFAYLGDVVVAHHEIHTLTHKLYERRTTVRFTALAPRDTHFFDD